MPEDASWDAIFPYSLSVTEFRMLKSCWMSYGRLGILTDGHLYEVCDCRLGVGRRRWPGMIDPPEDYIFDSITRDSGRSRRQVLPFDDNDSLSHLLDIFPSRPAAISNAQSQTPHTFPASDSGVLSNEGFLSKRLVITTSGHPIAIVPSSSRRCREVS